MSDQKERPFKKLHCDLRSRIFQELTPSELVVWLYHYLRSDRDDSSHPKVYTISKDTNLHPNTIKKARKSLRKKGWLITVAKSHRDEKTGLYTAPTEKAVVPLPKPQTEYKKCAWSPGTKNVPGNRVQKNASRQKRPPSNCAQGVDSGLEVDSDSEVDSKGGVERPATPPYLSMNELKDLLVEITDFAGDPYDNQLDSWHRLEKKYGREAVQDDFRRWVKNAGAWVHGENCLDAYFEAAGENLYYALAAVSTGGNGGVQ